MQINLQLISDFNIELLKRSIESKNFSEIIDIKTSSYGQLYQSIFSIKKDLNSVCFIWSLPESHIKLFNNALNFEDINKDKLIQEVEEYANLIISLSKKSKYVLIPTWQKLSYYTSYGISDLKIDNGISKLILDMNQKLSECFQKVSNIFLIDSADWQLNNFEEFNSKMWYLTKVPFTSDVFNKVSDTIIDSIRTLTSNNKKLIIVDLDNTLWGGLIGELTFEGINIGGHNYLGEAFKDFQKGLLRLHNKGVLLAIVSKNDEVIAMEAFEKNPEMILKKEHFVAMEINWNDKATNIIKIAREVNIGLDSLVFIDDNPVEREQVKILLPEVDVPDWSIDPTSYNLKLNQMRFFDTVNLTITDKTRNKTYIDNKKREQFKENLINKEDWLKKLDTVVELDELNSINIKRVFQLFNKTNQFNLSTRRLTEEEINSYYSLKENNMIIIDVKDKFGKLGIVGLIGTSLSKEKKLLVVDLILSCRAMGRGIEDTMLYLISQKAKDAFTDGFQLKYLKTKRNNPMLRFLKESSLSTKDGILFNSEKSIIFHKPSSVKINYQ